MKKLRPSLFKKKKMLPKFLIKCSDGQRNMLHQASTLEPRVSVQGSFGGHFACLCRGFVLFEVKRERKGK